MPNISTNHKATYMQIYKYNGTKVREYEDQTSPATSRKQSSYFW